MARSGSELQPHSLFLHHHLHWALLIARRTPWHACPVDRQQVDQAGNVRLQASPAAMSLAFDGEVLERSSIACPTAAQPQQSLGHQHSGRRSGAAERAGQALPQQQQQREIPPQ